MRQEILLILINGFVGVAVVGAITLVVQLCHKRARIRGNWSALFIEVEACGRDAQTFVTDKIQAPLYRLSTISFETCYPALLSDAAIKEDEAAVLLNFYAEVQTLNRGLDLADEVAKRPGPLSHQRGTLQELHDRNCLKADRIKRPNGTLYKPASQLCKARRY